MNRFIYISIALVSLLFSACSNEMDTVIPVEEPETVHLSVNLDREVNTKAQIYNIPNGYVQRYILEIWQQTSEYNWTCDRTKHRIIKTSESTNSNEFYINLPKGNTYKLAVWVDYVLPGTNGADCFYKTDSISGSDFYGLSKVKMINDFAYWSIDNMPEASPAEDAYTAYSIWDDTQKSLQITATRPFAQLNIFASDMNDWTGKLSFYTDFRLGVTINAGCNMYNVLDETASHGNVSRKVTTTKALNGLYNDFSYKGENTCFFSCYVFANKQGYPHTIWIDRYARAIDIELHKSTGGASYVVYDPGRLDAYNVPLKRNYATNISGNLLFQGCTFTVIGHNAFYDTYSQNQ